MSNTNNNSLKQKAHPNKVAVYKRYINYLNDWYPKHCGPEYTNVSPDNFEDYYANQAEGLNRYLMLVHVNEASHPVPECLYPIEMYAPPGLDTKQIKDYISCSSSPIEERIAAPVGVPDAVNLEIYDYDVTIIKVEK